MRPSFPSARLILPILAWGATAHGFPSAPRDSGIAPGASWGAGSALLLSIGATALPMAAAVAVAEHYDHSEAVVTTLFLGGMIIGPSAGQFALGAYPGAIAGSLVRTGGLVIFGIGAAEALGSAFCGLDFGGDPGETDCPENAGAGPMILGTLIYAGGALYSLIDIPFAELRRERRNARYGWAPILAPGPRGGTSAGLAAWARF